VRQPAAAIDFMEALQHDWRKTAGWRPKRHLLAHPTRRKRPAVTFSALLIAQINPCLAVADLRPIG
jgi:hypothetical protein